MKKIKLQDCSKVVIRLISVLLFVVTFPSISNSQQHYQLGSQISEQVTVADKAGTELSLQNIIAGSGSELSAVFVFGGGGMGHQRAEKNGGLWCPDSYEDLHILRSLHNHYKGKVAVIPIAVPPVFHSRSLGYEEDLFFKGRANPGYQKALMAFIDSTQAALKQGTIPVQPFYDNDFNFLISSKYSELRKKIIPVENWHGAFRAENETQHYGVPNLWLVDSTGKIIAEPFRGNIYRPHGGDITINYTLKEVVEEIEANLQHPF
jgi:hypothetical protein